MTRSPGPSWSSALTGGNVPDPVRFSPEDISRIAEERMSGETCALRFTLFQCRNPDDPMLSHEVRCFQQVLRPFLGELRTVNIVTTRPEAALFADTDIFLVGGAGEYSVLDGAPFLHEFFDFLREIVARRWPMFASCFGFQALTVALGGTVVHDPEHLELGTVVVHLNSAGRADPVFGGLPASFLAQVGHKDRAAQLPENAIPLAFSADCPYHAFRIRDTWIYATQFHPEMTHEQNFERFLNYIRLYGEDTSPEAIARARQQYRPSPEASALIPRYVRHILRHVDTGVRP